MKVEGELVRAGRVINSAVIARDKDMPSGSGTTCLKARESNNNTQNYLETQQSDRMNFRRTCTSARLAETDRGQRRRNKSDLIVV